MRPYCTCTSGCEGERSLYRNRKFKEIFHSIDLTTNTNFTDYVLAGVLLKKKIFTKGIYIKKKSDTLHKSFFAVESFIHFGYTFQYDKKTTGSSTGPLVDFSLEFSKPRYFSGTPTLRLLIYYESYLSIKTRKMTHSIGIGTRMNFHSGRRWRLRKRKK